MIAAGPPRAEPALHTRTGPGARGRADTD